MHGDSRAATYSSHHASLIWREQGGRRRRRPDFVQSSRRGGPSRNAFIALDEHSIYRRVRGTDEEREGRGGCGVANSEQAGESGAF